MRPPVYYLPISPTKMQATLKRILEANSEMSLESLANQIQQSPEEVQKMIERPEAYAEQYALAIERCVRSNPLYSRDEIMALLKEDK